MFTCDIQKFPSQIENKYDAICKYRFFGFVFYEKYIEYLDRPDFSNLPRVKFIKYKFPMPNSSYKRKN